MVVQASEYAEFVQCSLYATVWPMGLGMLLTGMRIESRISEAVDERCWDGHFHTVFWGDATFRQMETLSLFLLPRFVLLEFPWWQVFRSVVCDGSGSFFWELFPEFGPMDFQQKQPQNREIQEYSTNTVGIHLPASSYSRCIPTVFLGSFFGVATLLPSYSIPFPGGVRKMNAK